MSRPTSFYGNELTRAVEYGNLDWVRECLAQGQHPDDENALDVLWHSPLQRAISDVQDLGDDLVRVLLAAGANPNGDESSEGTP